jgi:phosphate transport system substrate-binding protein
VRKTIWLLAAGMSAAVCVGHAQKLNGAGATFPDPIYSKWFSEYSASHPGVQINYQPIGSGGGIRQVTAGTVDFGASDVTLTDEQLAASKVKIQAIPTVLGAVVPIFNLEGVSDLRIGPTFWPISTWARSQSGTTRVSPKTIQGSSYPPQDIFVVHRSDGSGTTFIFTDYLSKVSKDWAGGPGQGRGAELAEGNRRERQRRCCRLCSPIARRDRVRRTYLRHAEQDPLRLREERRRNLGQGIHRRECRKRRRASRSMPADYRVSITNAPGNAYPISSFTWLLIPNPAKDPCQREGPDRFSQVDAAASERGQRALLCSAARLGGAEGQCHHQHAEVAHPAHTPSVCAGCYSDPAESSLAKSARQIFFISEGLCRAGRFNLKFTKARYGR